MGAVVIWKVFFPEFWETSSEVFGETALSRVARFVKLDSIYWQVMRGPNKLFLTAFALWARMKVITLFNSW